MSNIQYASLYVEIVSTHRSRQPSPRVYRIRQLASVRSIFRIPLVAIHIQPVLARGRLDRLLGLNCLHPLLPSASLLWLRPSSVGTEDALQAQHPGRDLHVDEGEGRAEEEWAFGGGGGDELGELVFQIGRFLDLSVGFLGL